MLFADLVVLNGNIITVDDKNPKTEALAVKDEKFVAVGVASQIKELIGKDTKVIDVQRKTVLPGFIDAHTHPIQGGRMLLQVDCTSAKTISDVMNALRERAKTTPKGSWIAGSECENLELAEKKRLTRWILDEVSREHPIHLKHMGFHIGVVNSKALEIAGITKDTPNPSGGEFDRDENGELTGVCRESANFMFIFTPPTIIPPPTREEDKKVLHLKCEEYLSVGITSFADALVGPREIMIYQDALEEGLLPIRVYMIVSIENLQCLKELKLRTGFGNDRLKLGGIKMFVDGSIWTKGAYMYEPYEGEPDNYGIAMEQEELDNKVFEVHEAGFQLAPHANGDRAIDMLLDSYEKALTRLPRENHRHRIEHCTVVNSRILKRIKELGIVVIPHSYIYQHEERVVRWKEFGNTVSRMFAHRSFLDYGIPVAGNSDAVTAFVNPMLGFQSMVTRKTKDGEVLGPSQRISVEEAIRTYTLGGAYASFEENIKGSIEVGKLADFVILSHDPTKVDPDTIKDIEVEKTIVGGKVMYERQ